jgi:hypothetical protein
MRPHEATLPEANSKDTSWEWLCHVEQGSDKMAGSLNGCPLDLQGASQSMHEESKGC